MDTEENNNRSTPGMANRWGSNGKSVRLPLAPKSLWTVTAAMNLKDTHPLEEKQCQTLTAY